MGSMLGFKLFSLPNFVTLVMNDWKKKLKKTKKSSLNKKFEKDTKSGVLLEKYRTLEIKIWVGKIRPEQAQRRSGSWSSPTHKLYTSLAAHFQVLESPS